MRLFSIEIWNEKVNFVPPNFLIFVPREFRWRILRRRGCLWTPLWSTVIIQCHMLVKALEKTPAIQNMINCYIETAITQKTTVSSQYKSRPNILNNNSECDYTSNC